jgi:hypothetical protein
MQPPVHDWKTQLHSSGKEVPAHIWHHASHYVRQSSTFSCTYTLEDQTPDHYYSKLCNFTIYYTLGIWPYLWLLVCCCHLEYVVWLKSTDTALLQGRKDCMEAVQLSAMLAVFHITTVITLNLTNYTLFCRQWEFLPVNHNHMLKVHASLLLMNLRCTCA